MRSEIDLSRFKVIHGGIVVRAVALLKIGLPDPIPDNDTRIKPKFIDVLVINSDGNLEILTDEAWTFQFIPELSVDREVV